MLILAFPEVHWVFCTPYSAPNKSYEQAHLLTGSNTLDQCLDLQEAGCTPLFDPTGKRRIIRQEMRKIDRGAAAGQVPRRPKVAAAIDDEAAYSHFYAYTAYRFGYRGWTVTSWAMMEQLFGDIEDLEDSEEDVSTGIELLLEDLYCKFPDRPTDYHISDLWKREDEIKGIGSGKIKKRFIVTVGHQQHGQARQRRKRNKRYLREWVEQTNSGEEGRTAEIIPKPLGGIFELWKKTGMWEWGLWDSTGRPKTSKTFQWPPTRKQNSGQEDSGDHSAPGRLLAIAERLIGRSKSVLREAQSVSEAIYAATLALEAKELLANRTPTTALEALGLQHRAEVMAESMFHGIEFHLDVESRFRDIEREVEAIGRWFSGDRRKRVMLNARLAIIEDLARQFSKLDQFEEEQRCRSEARRLYFDFWAYQNPWRRPFRPLLRYLSFSLKSLPAFIGLVIFWIVLFGVGYHFLDPVVHETDARGFWEAFSSSTVYYFTLSMPNSYWGGEIQRTVLWNFVLAFQGFISLSHLGLLVSHIYLIISRR